MGIKFAKDFLTALAAVRSSAGLFNPWIAHNQDDGHGNGPQLRQERLLAHFSATDVRYIAVGEAPGYQGARVSGIPFTSEALLISGAIPRLAPTGRLSTRKLPWSEPSARIIWELLFRHGIHESTLLWNACPFHPYDTGPLSNRAPSKIEVEIGLSLLELLVESHPSASVLAIGNRASESLRRLNIRHISMRHPAYGGKTELANQLEAAVLASGNRNRN